MSENFESLEKRFWTLVDRTNKSIQAPRPRPQRPLFCPLSSEGKWGKIFNMITQREIYLDCNATHPLLPAVRAGLSEWIRNDDPRLANASSVHRRGQQAKAMVAQLRQRLCETLGRPDGDEFILLSGATEAINLALRGFREERAAVGRKALYVCTNIEHRAVLDTLKELGRDHQVLTLNVNDAGELATQGFFDTLACKLESDPKLDVMITLQVCNNETGIVLKIHNFLEELHKRFAPRPIKNLPKGKGGKYPETERRVWALLDAAQALGKLPDDALRRPMHFADAMAISAHKIGGPSGVGTLWVRSGTPFKPQITGGTQERKRRAGTLNSLGAAGFLLALEDWAQNGEAHRKRMSQLRDKVAQALGAVPGIAIHGLQSDGSLPGLSNTLNFHAEGCPEESLLLALDLDGFCLSSGSACNSGSLKPSHVLMALGYSEEVALSSIRVSLGVETTEAEVDSFIDSVKAKVLQIRLARRKSAEMFGAEKDTSRT